MLWAPALGAQQLAPKRTLAASAPTGCAAFPPLSLPFSTSPLANDGETRRVIDLGQEAALQGEHAAARDAFAQAAARSPGNALVRYYLGREHEALGSSTDAVREYCHYLQLAPAARDADEVRGRIVRLVPASELSRLDDARATFRSGVALLERRQYTAADSMFARTADALPTAPESFFNRGLARAARGQRAAATEDFEKYLELSGSAPDRVAIRAALTRLQDRVFPAGQAFGSGLLFPGMGQMSTGRPVLGVMVLGAIAGAAAWGLTSTDGFEVATFRDPFGNQYVDSLPSTRQPYFAAALATAGVVWLGAAMEARAFAGRTQRRAESIINLTPQDDQAATAFLGVGPASVGVGLRLRLR